MWRGATVSLDFKHRCAPIVLLACGTVWSRVVESYSILEEIQEIDGMTLLLVENPEDGLAAGFEWCR